MSSMLLVQKGAFDDVVCKYSLLTTSAAKEFFGKQCTNCHEKALQYNKFIILILEGEHGITWSPSRIKITNNAFLEK